MNQYEFKSWLEGYLADKDSLSKKQLETIRKQLAEVSGYWPGYWPQPYYVPWTQPVWYQGTGTRPLDPPYTITCTSHDGPVSTSTVWMTEDAARTLT